MFSLRCCALSLTLTAFATVTLASQPKDATVRIVSARGLTTGTVIHQSAQHGTYILTCKHGYKAGDTFSFVVDGKTVQGERRVDFTDGDLALVWKRGTLTKSVAPVAKQDVAEGETCLSIGHDQPMGMGKFSPTGSTVASSWTSTTRRVLNIAKNESGKVCMSIETATKHRGGPGRSGGGLFNAEGNLVGVCSQDRLEGCVFVSHSAIVRFLNRCHAKGLLPWWTPAEAFDNRAVEELVEFYVGWANNYRLEKRYEEAIESYTAALALSPELAEAHYGRGLTHRAAGQQQKALEDFRLAMNGRYKAPAQSQIVELTSLIAGN
jgi:hypothetical protein